MNNTARRESGSPMWLISASCWPIAVLAYAAAAGMLVGVIDPNWSTSDTSSFISPVIAAVVVASVVGLPMTLAATRAQSRRRSTAPTAFVAGVFLVACVAIDATLTHQFGYLHSLFAFAGVAVATLGYRLFVNERITLSTQVDR